MGNKLADSYFDKAFRKHIMKGFSSYGFKKYRSRFIARIVGDSIFQLIGFQKEAYGSKGFTVNIAFRPLYIPHDFLVLEPGDRLCRFMNENHKWWSFENEENAEENFSMVSDVIRDKVIPMFDILNNTKTIIKYYDKKDIFPITWYSDPAPGAHFLAYTLLKEYRFEEAADNFNKALMLYNSYYRTPATKESAIECENCIKICKAGKVKADEYLKKCELKSLQVLKIDKEKYYYNK